MRTETLAIVFTDLKGYTAATSGQTHKENAIMLRRVARIVEPVVKGFSGRVVKSIGDAYMIVFHSPTEAARCATAVIDRLHQHNSTASAEEQIHLRVAMNIGEVRVHRGDVFGEPVNIAARVESITPADEIYLTEALYLTMNRSEIPTELVGEYELKGIPEPVTVYRALPFAEANGEDEEDEAEGSESAEGEKGLPFGGKQLAHWHRVRWLRMAYQALWMIAVAGVVGAAYLRYKPSSDFSHVVEQARLAAEAGKPQDVLAASGQLPPEARKERQAVRRYRRRAVDLLIQQKEFETANTELEELLATDPRDADSHMLRALLRNQNGDIAGSMDDIERALKLKAKLVKRPELVEALVDGYQSNETRKKADHLVETVVQKAAIVPLARALSTGKLTERTAQYAVANRLEKLGAGHEVDWVVLAIEDLKSTSCKVRKGAIRKLSAENDDRAVGPLMKVAEAGGCGAALAKNTANALIK